MLAERDKMTKEMQGLQVTHISPNTQGSLEERAKMAGQLNEENKKLKEEIAELKEKMADFEKLKQEIEELKLQTTNLNDEKVELVAQVGTLEEQVTDYTGKYQTETTERKKEQEETAKT